MLVKWFEEQDATGNYMHNVKTVMSNAYVEDKHLGILVSAASVYLKALEKAEVQKQTQVENIVTPDKGRYEFTGRIVSFKEYESEYGTTVKMLVQCEGYRLFGTVPKQIRYEEPEIGDTVKLAAMVYPLEVGFGRYTRPSKASISRRSAA